MKTLLFLTGPSCAGKTTITKELMQLIPNTYLVSYDQLKLQLTGYDREEHRAVMRRLTMGYLEVVCSEGFFVFVELWPFNDKDCAIMQTIADKYGYEVLSVNITAPDDILLERSRQRIAKAVEEGRKNSVMDIEIYREGLEIKNYLPKASLQIDTSRVSSSDATGKIMKHLGF
jgi:adenylylsulfate kinase-like enzyme